MQEKHLYEYAVIRLVPRVEREEFINVGVILYCASNKFLRASVSLDENRLRAFSNAVDIEEIRENLSKFQQICEGGDRAGVIGKLPASARFHWLTAIRSTIIQTSTVHLGLCDNAQTALDRLMSQLVE